MKYMYLFATAVLSLMLCAPAIAQAQYPADNYGHNWRAVMSQDDQREFDKDYSKWVAASQKNDQDDIRDNARKMEDIMSRNNIPSDVPFDQIAAAAPGYAPAYPAATAPRLSADDQQKFDEHYAKWMDAQRKNDAEDVAKESNKMREIMARDGIPENVPFGAVATNSGYAPAPYPQASYPVYGQPAQRLSDKDQKDFDKAYRDWIKARDKRDMDDVDKNAHKMEDIMARYSIPANVPFDQIATPAIYH